jgi:hypothetical protein
LGTKPKWTCAACGMYSSRKSSVKRHIQNIHGRNTNFVSFVDYLVGRNMGLYWPMLPPTYQKKNDVKRIDYGNIMKEEVGDNALEKEWETP